MNIDARRAVLIALIAFSTIFHGARMFLSVRTLLDPAGTPLSPFALQGRSPVVNETSPQAASAGLQKGDVVESLDGRPLRGFADLRRSLREAAPAGSIAVSLKRGDTRQTIRVPLGFPPATPLTLGPALSVLVLDLLAPAFFLGLGFVVVWAKPREPAAWLLLLLMTSFSSFGRSLYVPWSELGPIAGSVFAFWLNLTFTLWAFALAAFILAFPEPLDFDRRHPWIKVAFLYVPHVAWALLSAGSELSIARFEWGETFALSARGFGRTALLAVYATVGLFFAILGMKFGTAKNPDSQRRLGILMVGAWVGLTPSGIVATMALVRKTSYGAGVPDVLLAFMVAMMLIFPLTLAYVVIVHKAMGIGVAIRQGLQYALAQRAVRIVQVLVGIAVGAGLVELLADPDNRRVDRVQWMAGAVLFVVLFQRGAEWLKKWIDRRFFREAVDSERVLAELGDRVRTIGDRRELMKTVAERIAEAFHIPRVAAFLRVDTGFAPAFAHGFGSCESIPEFSDANGLAARVEGLAKPQTVYLDDERSWAKRESLPDTETAKLRDLGSEVLLPLRTKARAEGFLSLGPKASEAAYSPSDLQLLQSVANQTALSLDNTRLVEQVASEVARRERMTREIEIAREVQFTLLPQTPPVVEGLDLAGFCRPAAGIGGDYYDFIARDGERAVGLAIGDIAGKGIPAALLMAGLQAALRGQALDAGRDLTRVMSNVNRLIFESSPPNRYATFFYGERRGDAIAYVNAGHNAPMLMRRDGTIERLDRGGPVIGLMDIAVFEEGSIDVRPGDILLGYTDGVSECMSPKDEEWGEERLMAVLRSCASMRAAEIVARVMSEADAFANGAKQHDDMTLIVMRAL